MELTLLGTAAAEGWPAPFCRCPQCQEARRRGGVNIRTRSGALIDQDLKIDFCADTLVQMQRLGRCLDAVRAIVFTHQHCDHVAPDELRWMMPPFTQTPPPQPIAVYGNAEVLSMLRRGLGDNFIEPRLQLHEMQALQPVTTPAGDTIVPLPADHVAGAFVLRITRADGKSIFYGHDSGLYPQATLDALAGGKPVDIALFDCTSGGVQTANRGHMDLRGVVQMIQTLRERGTVTDSTQLIATHFSHNGGLLHEELVRAFLPHQVQVAFDGMVVRV
jgi:phosphoribosyl 1,2-cyclic phosphate phosphodiesterase